jgi:hypothetical protein
MQAESMAAAPAAASTKAGEGGVTFVTSLDSKAQAWWGLSPKMLAQFQGRLLAVLIEQHQQGVVNMSAKELRKAYFQSTGAWVDMSSISSTVHGLVKGKRVERLPVLRKCSESGHEISPIRAVPQQQALV